MYFILNLFVLLLLIFCGNSNHEKTRRAYVTILTVVMITLSGLRHEFVGSDTTVYLYQFDNSLSDSWSDIFSVFMDAYFNPNRTVGKDPAMWIVNKTIGLISTNHVFFLMVTSAFPLIMLGVFFFRNTRTTFEIAFAYIFFNTLYYTFLPNSAIRQSMALGFVLAAYLTLPKGKLIKPIVFIILASLFHKSALLAFLFIILNKIIRPKEVYWFTFPLMLLMLMFYKQVGAVLADSSEIYSAYGSGRMFAQGGRPFVVVLFFIGIYALGIFALNKFNKTEVRDPKVSYPIIGSALTLLFLPLVRLNSTLIRITAFFVVWMCLFCPIILEKFNPSFRKVISIGIVALLLYRSYVEPQQYAFFWQSMVPME